MTDEQRFGLAHIAWMAEASEEPPPECAINAHDWQRADLDDRRTILRCEICWRLDSTSIQKKA